MLLQMAQLLDLVRLGHPSYEAMRRLVRGKMVKNLPLTMHQVKKLAKIPCDACLKAKAKRLPFPKESTTKIRAPLQRLHLDIMGPVHIRGLRGEYYILCLTDQFSGYAEVLALRSRDDSATWVCLQMSESGLRNFW